MAWIEGFTTPGTILKDLATQLTTANTLPNGDISEDNWELIFPRPYTIGNAINEALTATDETQLVFQASAEHQQWYEWGTPQIMVGGIPAQDGTYTIDFSTGTVTFPSMQTEPVTATFAFNEHYNLSNGLSAITNRVVLATTITNQDTNINTSLYNSDPSQNVTKLKMYMEFLMPQFMVNPEMAVSANGTTIPNFHFFQVRSFDGWNDLTQDIYARDINALNGNIVDMGSRVSDWAKFSWYQDWQEQLVAEVNGSLNPEDITQGVSFNPIITKGLYNDSPIQYYLSTNSQRVSLVIMGDPTVDYANYLISFGYFGRISSFTYSTTDALSSTPVTNYYSNDTAGNFGITVGSSTVPAMSTDGGLAVIRDGLLGTVTSINTSSMWGDNTGNGVSDICMYKTRSGVHFQKHQISFITPEEYTAKDAFNPSRWTGKFHLSPAYVIHGYDGYRGFLDGVVVVDNSSIVHLDDLVVNQGQPNEEVYKYFKISAPFSIFESSANWHYGIAIKKV